MVFMILMVNKYVPTIHEKDDVLEKVNIWKNYLMLNIMTYCTIQKYSCGSLFDFCMLLSRGNAYTPEFFILGTKLSWYLFYMVRQAIRLVIFHLSLCLLPSISILSRSVHFGKNESNLFTQRFDTLAAYRRFCKGRK